MRIIGHIIGKITGSVQKNYPQVYKHNGLTSNWQVSKMASVTTCILCYSPFNKPLDQLALTVEGII